MCDLDELRNNITLGIIANEFDKINSKLIGDIDDDFEVIKAFPSKEDYETFDSSDELFEAIDISQSMDDELLIFWDDYVKLVNKLTNVVKQSDLYITCCRNNANQDEPCGKQYQRLYKTVQSFIMYEKNNKFEKTISSTDWVNNFLTNAHKLKMEIKEEAEEQGFSKKEKKELIQEVGRWEEIIRTITDPENHEVDKLINKYNLVKKYCDCRGLPRTGDCDALFYSLLES